MLKEKKVSIIAPSSPPKNKKWREGLKILKSWGLRVDFPDSSLNPDFFHSNSDLKRAFFLKRAWSQKSVSAVWMLRGGYGCQKVCSSFSPSLLKENKLFIGYSDGTALHLYLNAKNELSLHAPTLSELRELSLKEQNTLRAVLLGQKKQLCFKNLKLFAPSLKSFFKKKVLYPLKTQSSAKQKKLHSSGSMSIKGKITGGNLSLISTSVGAFPFPSSEFLFLEDINESAYKVDRLLHHLLYSGVLKSTKAILFGDFYPLKNKELQKVLQSFSQSCPLLFIYGLPCGHTKRMPLPLNTLSELSLTKEKASLTVNTFACNS